MGIYLQLLKEDNPAYLGAKQMLKEDRINFYFWVVKR